jgi:molybdenum cofactor synthesis domain-containing protein
MRTRPWVRTVTTELRASILVIGDELLGGFVHDTNSGFIAERLRDHHVPLDRVQVVPDEMDAIDEALQAELARARPRVIVTTGGIGSTPDDITFEAVAASLGRDVVEDSTIAQLLDGAMRWTEEQGIALDAESRHQFLRMARIPVGAELMPTDGWAPAVRVDVDGGTDAGGVTIVILPGVPSQMRTLMTSGVEPALLIDRNDPWDVVELTHGYPESLLNPTFLRLEREHPEVKLGSYPGSPMLVRLQGAPPAVALAATLVRDDLAALDASAGGKKILASWGARLRESTGDDSHDGARDTASDTASDRASDPASDRASEPEESTDG